MIIFADALLVYRCFIVFEAPWAWIISVPSGLSLLGSFGCFIAQVSLSEKRLGPGGVIFIVAGTYTSLLANLIVSPALILRVWLARREMESLVGESRFSHTHVPYTRLIEILTESAVPPLLLGLLHLILHFAIRDCHFTFINMLWVSFTILAPQTLTLRVLDGPKHIRVGIVSSHTQTLPIAFRMGATDMSTQITSRVEEETLHRRST
ncbi:hypothetical protein BKA70DRAFT_190881 [Coprinopsis sp. MPI-PUGE-AT-0042]|nr:hypothetical protein BKA70DRAFT_190881 [Coprinopsis sp. MPI-PUGE-AT-0042]